MEWQFDEVDDRCLDAQIALEAGLAATAIHTVRAVLLTTGPLATVASRRGIGMDTHAFTVSAGTSDNSVAVETPGRLGRDGRRQRRYEFLAARHGKGAGHWTIDEWREPDPAVAGYLHPRRELRLALLAVVAVQQALNNRAAAENDRLRIARESGA